MLHRTDNRWLFSTGRFTKLLLLPVLLISSLLLTGCAASNGPEQAAIGFLTAAEKNDAITIASFFHPRDREEMKDILYAITRLSYEESQEHKGIKNLKINKVGYSSDKTHAQVDLIIEYNDNDKIPMTIYMLSEAGKWYIDLD